MSQTAIIYPTEVPAMMNYTPAPKHPPGQTAVLVAFGVAFVGGVFGTIAGMETLDLQRCASWTALVFALPVYLYLKVRERAHYRPLLATGSRQRYTDDESGSEKV